MRILLHPIGLDRKCWQFTGLNTSGALDLPGHGDRLAVPVPPSVELIADDVAARIKGSFDVVGVSAGGMAALHLAVHYPERVRSIVLACTSVRADPGTALQRAADVERNAMAGVLESTLARWFSPDALHRGGHQGVVYAHARLLADDPAAFAVTWRAIAHHDVTTHLGEIRQPVTVLAGSTDVSTPATRMAQFKEQSPNSRFEVIDGPHMVMLENPVGFAQAITRHVEWAT